MSKTAIPRRKAPASAKILRIMGLSEKQAVARTQSHPDDPKGWKSLGAHCLESGRLADARGALERALTLAPRDAEAMRVMADLEVKAGSLEDARRLLEEALEIEPRHQLGKIKLAEILHRQGQHEQALRRLETVTGPDASLSPWFSWQGVILLALQRYDEARRAFETQIKLDPVEYSAWNNLGNVHRDIGDLDQAERCYAKAASLNNTDPLPRSNRLTAMHYQPGATVEDILQACKDWGSVFAPATRPQRPAPADRSSSKVLRVGMFSDGFRQHPVGTMTVSALEHLAKLGVEIYAYTTNNSVDAITRRFMALARQWTPIYHLNNEQFAARIRADQIDILIDLSGHNAGSRISVMTMEPAPILVKWVGGLINTTGVEAIDYLISDKFESPEGSDHLYTEKLIRMPDDYICFVPPAKPPEVASLPALRNGYITFGCFNNPTKINPILLAHWAELLHAVPQSRLFLKGAAYATQELRQRVVDTLAGHGIGEDRLRIEGRSPHLELLACYNEVDIALDPWPYSGGLTTCEAMLMGVPVVTLPGPTFAGRHSATHLVNAGMPELVVDDWSQYRARVLDLASDLDSLSTIRAHLRRILLESAVCDAPRFARHLADALRAIWQRDCDGRQPAALRFNTKGQLYFDDDATPLALAHPELEHGVNDTTWSFSLNAKIVTLDHGGTLVCDQRFTKLSELRALTAIAIDPACRITIAEQLANAGHLQDYHAHIALGDGKPSTLYACLDAALSGTLEPLPADRHMPLPGQEVSVLARIPIPTIRLDDIDGLSCVDWLVLDDRHDNVKILSGAGRLLDSVLLVQIRVVFPQISREQPDLAVVTNALGRHGLRLLRLDNPQYRSWLPVEARKHADYASQLFSADAIFVPDDQRIRSMDSGQRSKLAFILHAAYQSPDFAYRVLQATGSDIAEGYLSAQLPAAAQDATNQHDPNSIGHSRAVSGADASVRLTAPMPATPHSAPRLRGAPSSGAAGSKQPAGGKRPFVSVVVPSYNRAEDLRRCLYSILAVDCDDLEIVVSDNASPDHTQEVLAEFTDPRIKAYRQNENIGAELNMAFLFEKAAGEWVITLTDDDWLMPQAISVIREAVRINPEVGFILSPLRQINADGQLVSDHLVIPSFEQQRQQHGFRVYPAGADSLRELFWHGHVFSRWILRRDVIDLDGYRKQIGRHLYSPMWITSKALLSRPTLYTTTHVVTHRVFNKIYWEYPDDYMYGGVIGMIKELLPDQPIQLSKMLAMTANRAISQIPFVLSHGEGNLERYVHALMKFPEFTKIPDFSSTFAERLQAANADESLVRMVRDSQKSRLTDG